MNGAFIGHSDAVAFTSDRQGAICHDHYHPFLQALDPPQRDLPGLRRTVARYRPVQVVDQFPINLIPPHDDRFSQLAIRSTLNSPLQADQNWEPVPLNTPTERQLTVLYAAITREAGGHWTIERVDGLDCIEHGWLTEDYYLTDVAKRLLRGIEQ
jgi:hypothetical protein